VPTPSSPPIQGATLERYKAVYDFDAVENNELSFKEGDIILVSKKMNDWWIGQLENGGKKGLVPSTYLQPIQ
jgi:hypothetical protein